MPPPGNDAPTEKKLRTYDDDDIVRYSIGLDVPIVGLLRNREEYKEMREIALIYGTTLGIRAKTPATPAANAAGDASGAPLARDDVPDEVGVAQTPAPDAGNAPPTGAQAR